MGNFHEEFFKLMLPKCDDSRYFDDEFYGKVMECSKQKQRSRLEKWIRCFNWFLTLSHEQEINFLLRMAFDACDRDKSGSISSADLRALSYHGEKLPHDEIAEIIRDDDDGNISYDEFLEIVRGNNIQTKTRQFFLGTRERR